jgi:hypothetical protein
MAIWGGDLPTSSCNIVLNIIKEIARILNQEVMNLRILA